MVDLPADTAFLLSTLPPGRRQQRAAWMIIAVQVVSFAAMTPFGAIQLPFYIVALGVMQTLIFAADLIIAILLYSQFAILGWRSLLWLAGCYVYSAIVGVFHFASFPGVLSETGVFGREATGWLFVAWHGALPVATIAYALRQRADRDGRRRSLPSHGAIAFNAVAMIAAACATLGLSILANDRLPPMFIDGVHISALSRSLEAVVVLLFFVALALLWRPQRSVLDLWLSVILTVWLISIVYSGVFLGARFTVAFYVSRAYWLVTAILILLVLLTESATLYARLAYSIVLSRRQRASQTIAVGAMSESFANELSEPIAEMIASGEIALRLLRESQPDLKKAKRSLEQVAGDGRRASDAIKSVRSIFQDSAARKEPTDVNAILRDALAIDGKRLRDASVQVDLKLAGALPEVLADRGQLLHVVLSLIGNAIDLMSAGTAHARVLTVQTRLSGTGRVSIAFLDSGPAQAEFAPFAASRGQDAGLGLWLCRRIVELHDGTLTAEAGAVRGSVFTITLPGVTTA